MALTKSRHDHNSRNSLEVLAPSLIQDADSDHNSRNSLEVLAHTAGLELQSTTVEIL